MIKDTELEIEDLDKLELAAYEDEVASLFERIKNKQQLNQITLKIYLKIYYLKQ